MWNMENLKMPLLERVVNVICLQPPGLHLRKAAVQ